jgi:hypothetical protein
MEDMMPATTDLAKYPPGTGPHRMGFRLKGSGRGRNQGNMSYNWFRIVKINLKNIKNEN